MRTPTSFALLVILLLGPAPRAEAQLRAQPGPRPSMLWAGHGLGPNENHALLLSASVFPRSGPGSSPRSHWLAGAAAGAIAVGLFGGLLGQGFCGSTDQPQHCTGAFLRGALVGAVAGGIIGGLIGETVKK
jgi:hypothetical protein